MSKNYSSPNAPTVPIEDRLFCVFMERFKKFSLDFKARNSHTFPVSEHFVDNDSSTSHIVFGEDDMKNAWQRHLRGIGCKMTYARNSENDMVLVRDYSDPVVNGRFIEVPNDVAIKILALGYIP